MSYADDRKAEIDALLEQAWEKCVHGRKYSPAYELASRIRGLRSVLQEKEKKNQELNSVERRYMLQTAGILLLGAITASKKLREVANALDAPEVEDVRQAKILRAYEDCIVERYPPTLAELQAKFEARFGKESWLRLTVGLEGEGSTWPVRKTLKLLGLTLRMSKRGRPIGSRAKIGNPKR